MVCYLKMTIFKKNLSNAAFGEPYSYSGTALYDYAADGVDADSETDLLETPQFVVQAEDLIVNEGDSIRLPCKVDRLEGFVILWKKSDDIITVATQIIEKVRALSVKLVN